MANPERFTISTPLSAGLGSTLAIFGAMSIATAANQAHAPPQTSTNEALDVCLGLDGCNQVQPISVVNVIHLPGEWSLLQTENTTALELESRLTNRSENTDLTDFDWACFDHSQSMTVPAPSSGHIHSISRGLIPGWGWGERTMENRIATPVAFFVESDAAWRAGNEDSLRGTDGESLVVESRSSPGSTVWAQPIFVRVDFQCDAGSVPSLDGSLFVGDIEDLQVRDWVSNRFIDPPTGMTGWDRVMHPTTRKVQVRIQLRPRSALESNVPAARLDRAAIRIRSEVHGESTGRLATR